MPSDCPKLWPALRGPSQLDLGFRLANHPDRNADKGGRSFYFFDLDDNVFHLDTPIYIYDLRTGLEHALSTRRFSEVAPHLGKPGPYEHFGVNGDDRVGSFRRFRDQPGFASLEEQPFVEDVKAALASPDFHWKGPSWDCFEYAVHNERPIALITARGHAPTTIKAALLQFVKAGFLTREPNYLDIYAVNHPELKLDLAADAGTKSTAELKKLAIIQCVETAMKQYGKNPHHRFGMSDDDHANIELITEAKRTLKARYPENSFFVINTGMRPFLKYEILLNQVDQGQTTASLGQSQLGFEF